MAHLFQRPPKYCLHKGTKQAVVFLHGMRIYLGPYGSSQSHQRYQEILKQWEAERDRDLSNRPVEQTVPSGPRITPAMLREKRKAGSPLTINELVFVDRQHTHEYDRKNGRVTPEATIIDDVIRYLRKQHATEFIADLGPVALDELRKGMITELDWSRKQINKQVARLIRMFTWAAEKELVEPSVPKAFVNSQSPYRNLTRSLRLGSVCNDAISNLLLLG